MTATELVGCLQLASRNWRDLAIAGLQGPPPSVAANYPSAVWAGRRQPDNAAGTGTAPREAATGRVDSYGLSRFYRDGVELRHFSFQRSYPVFEACQTT